MANFLFFKFLNFFRNNVVPTIFTKNLFDSKTILFLQKKSAGVDENECGNKTRKKEKYFERENSVSENRGTNLFPEGDAL